MLTVGAFIWKDGFLRAVIIIVVIFFWNRLRFGSCHDVRVPTIRSAPTRVPERLNRVRNAAQSEAVDRTRQNPIYRLAAAIFDRRLRRRKTRWRNGRREAVTRYAVGNVPLLSAHCSKCHASGLGCTKLAECYLFAVTVLSM